MRTFGLLSYLLLVLCTSAGGLMDVPGLVTEIIHVEQTLPWVNAKEYCLDNFERPFGAKNMNELMILNSSTSQLSWVGLNRQYALWYWVDETMSNYFNWFGKCASLNRAGYWYNTTCDNKQFFLCKKVSGDWVLIKENKTWIEAKQHCETHHAGLAIISNEDENNIIRVLIDAGFAWIGLGTVEQNSLLEETWRFVGVNAPVTFSKWFSRLFCALMDWKGFWYDRVCSEKHPFICFRKVNNILEFSLVNDNKPWKDAQSHCKLLNMDLVMVKTENELIQLLVYIRAIHSSFVDDFYVWIGLYNNPWFWDNSLLKIQYWNKMQPDNVDSKNRTITTSRQACGASKNGEMFDESCVDPLPFFCLATVRSMIMVSQPKSWMEALQHCRDRYVDFASLSTAIEQQVAENKIKDAQNNYVWIGLNFLAGGWIWVYGDNIQYNNWVTGVNLQCSVALRCGALTVSNGKWEPRPCEEKLEFLCFQT